MDYKTALIEFRAKHNLTQTQLAKILGCSLMSVFRYESGINEPSAMHKIQIKNKMKEWEEKKNGNVSL